MDKVFTINAEVEYIVSDDTLLFIETAGKGSEMERMAMNTDDKKHWHVQITTSKQTLKFRFVAMRNWTITNQEMPHMWHEWKAQEDSHTRMRCWWNTFSERSYLYSSAFKDCVYAFEKQHRKFQKGNLLFNLCSQIPFPKGIRMVITGNIPELGLWQPLKAPQMKRSGSYSYECSLHIAETEEIEYKYAIIDRENHVIWEDGWNRFLHFNPSSGGLIIEDEPIRIKQKEGRIGGLVVPVFSLRTERSQGVGDFGDLKQITLMASNVGLHLLQLLPVGDTSRTGSWTDSYPYSAISEYALHPMYTDLHALSPLKNKRVRERLEKKAEKLNKLKQVDYEKVNLLKEEWLRAFFRQEGNQIVKSSEFKHFVKKSCEWLVSYCCYRFFISYFGTPDFNKWPFFNSYNEHKVLTWINENGYGKEIEYYSVVQFILHQQLLDAHTFARKHNVILKGDIPIGISRESATTWVNPQYFHFNGQAGAPPDYFSIDGQNWGFPTYNWENIMAENGLWWKKRLRHMAQYFDAYRIDHVLGFFRIWEIPYPFKSGMVGHFNPMLPLSEEEIRKTGYQVPLPSNHLKMNEDELKEQLFFQDKNGFVPSIGGTNSKAFKELSYNDQEAYRRIYNDFFFKRHNDFWTHQAIRKLSIVTQETEMLPCAEDLGMIPDCMRDVLNHLKILSLEVETMPKYSWGRFSNLEENPLLSVDIITTHDMPTMRLWWKQNPETAQEYYNEKLHKIGKAPQLLSSSLCRHILYQHLASPSILCIISLQDWISISDKLRSGHLEQERINDPANSHHYWRWRMEPTLESITTDSTFLTDIQELLIQTERFQR